MVEPILNEARAKQNLNEPNIESNVKYKLGEELLKELRRNTYSGRVEEDVFKIPNVDKDELRLQVFSKSLSGDAEKWLSSEETATTWKELVDKSFHKYYPLSHTYKSKIPDDLDHGTDYFEFLY
ncbi:hypothetical protein Tco_0907687 [Tanacetum coccineum]|uniref:Uncharacterized protein n=1 Tax=Tanacetum coccineum TaxID=301880 RepID=A0ABQ5CLF4_9ASTR